MRVSAPRERLDHWGAISFDLDGTLYDYARCHRHGLAAAARVARARLDLSRQRFVRLYGESRARVHRRLDGTAASHSRLLYLQELVYRCRGTLCVDTATQLEAAYWAVFYARMRLFPGIATLIGRLRQHAIPLALTTDMLAAIQFRKILRVGLRDAFDVVVTSEEAGRDKPDSRIFQLCIERLGRRPWEVVHVGDDYRRDVQGARRAGLAAIWFAPSGRARGAVRTAAGLWTRLSGRP